MIKKLISSLELTLRVLKNVFLRPFRVIYNKVVYFFSAGRMASALPGAAKKLPKILKTKPEKREDYFDWGSVYVAKSLVLMIVLLLIIIPIVYILLIHPLLTSWFWVKDFQFEDAKLASYSGKVRVYYDEDFEQLKFKGRLKDGKAVEFGEQYYENGRYMYSGDFADDLYEGSGILYFDDGAVNYRGEFSQGKFNGNGELTEPDGSVYSGSFENGKLQGRGTITRAGSLFFEGTFVDGIADGIGRQMYPDGTVQCTGTYSAGVLQGMGIEYYSNGAMKYNGNFLSGVYNGEGILYSENGAKQYSGGFEMGKYSGSGMLYRDGQKLYSGEFEQGKYNGSGTLYCDSGAVISGTFAEGRLVGAGKMVYPNGRYYEGSFSDNKPHGAGVIYDVTGTEIFSGNFVDGDIDFSEIVGKTSTEVKELICNLEQRVDTNWFFLENNSVGASVKCSFAGDGVQATAVEMFVIPLGGETMIIKSESDISAPTAKAVEKRERALPTWAAELYSVSADSVVCYAAVYDKVTVYYWVDSFNGVLMLKSAVCNDGFDGTSADETVDYSLSYEEIVALFEELGLDIADFKSLGF